MPHHNNWTRQQTLAALHIYLQLPFGQLHHRNPLIKQLAGWIGRTPSAVALKLVNLASLDPQIVASGRVGMGNASNLDKQIWQELNANWDAVATEAAAAYESFGIENGVSPGADVIDEVPEIAEGKSITATVKVRVNQARFRRAVLASYNARCCVSGLAVPQLLIASHIIPWADDHKNRLNPRNGLCLSALHDKAYDRGLITVLPSLTIRVSPELRSVQADEFTRTAIAAFDGRSIRMPERFKPDEAFLTAHAQRFGFL
ncbi:MAG: HNH endonuclease [Burkholderiaceae bacterium]|nr:HNH endonuclease [Burkholderiaceae bacterium]